MPLLHLMPRHRFDGVSKSCQHSPAPHASSFIRRAASFPRVSSRGALSVPPTDFSAHARVRRGTAKASRWPHVSSTRLADFRQLNDKASVELIFRCVSGDRFSPSALRATASQTRAASACCNKRPLRDFVRRPRGTRKVQQNCEVLLCRSSDRRRSRRTGVRKWPAELLNSRNTGLDCKKADAQHRRGSGCTSSSSSSNNSCE